MSVALMQTLVIPIQSELPEILSTSAANASWVVTITLLGAAVAMPIAGRLGDLFGKQRVLVGSSILMLAGSLVCALSDSLVPVLAGRGLQGLAMGFNPGRHQPDARDRPAGHGDHRGRRDERDARCRRRDRLPLSAWIVQTGDWHALFWVATGLAVLVGLGSWLIVPHVHDGHEGTFDFGGAVGLAVGLIALLVGITKGNTWGWTSGRPSGASRSGSSCCSRGAGSSSAAASRCATCASARAAPCC